MAVGITVLMTNWVAAPVGAIATAVTVVMRHSHSSWGILAVMGVGVVISAALKSATFCLVDVVCASAGLNFIVQLKKRGKKQNFILMFSLTGCILGLYEICFMFSQFHFFVSLDFSVLIYLPFTLIFPLESVCSTVFSLFFTQALGHKWSLHASTRFQSALC